MIAMIAGNMVPAAAALLLALQLVALRPRAAAGGTPLFNPRYKAADAAHDFHGRNRDLREPALPRVQPTVVLP
eukprot:SAG22_NODE_7575_length_727_cov_1.380573_2_plen_73_part_00